MSYTRLKCGRALVTTRDSLSNAAEAALSFRINIKFRLPKSAALEGWLARSKDARSRLLRRDSRLWISVAMAALSAVLALLVISGVRGRAPDASPAKVSPNRPATPVQKAAANAVTKPSPATRSARSKPVQTVVNKASLSKHATKVTSRKVTGKKIHHNEDDDYVAKDTYVYYGPNGKSTR